MGYTGLPVKAIDGDATGSWCGTNGTSGWLKVGFAQARTISQIGIWWGSHKHTFSVDLSVDGNTWTTVIPSQQSTNSEGAAPVFQAFDIAPTNAKFIRVNITATSAPGSHIYQAIINELQAYAK